jgi:release factor glutamine methyltransferase
MGLVTFSGLQLETAPGEVMTPRSTSERVVAEALAQLGDGRARVADVGTGTGALAVAIAARHPAALVWATDLDARAVALARANVARLGLGDRVLVHQGDLLVPVPAPLDLIVANLPYLAERTATWHPDLADEPLAAVFGAGDGLGAYRRLLAEASTKLAPGGTVVLQLYGEVVVAAQDELESVREFLDVAARAAA